MFYSGEEFEDNKKRYLALKEFYHILMLLSLVQNKYESIAFNKQIWSVINGKHNL